MKQTKQNQTELEKKDNSSPGGVNEDKEFLRTEPLGKLLLRLALPTVAAQLINMLYNIVDRIYIGHMRYGSDGRRRLYAIDHDCFCICSPGGIRRSAQSLYFYGKTG